MKMVNVPTFRMNSNFLLQEDFDIYLLKHHDEFFRRIVEHVVNRLEDIEKDNLLCKIQDDDGSIFELRLPEDGFMKAVDKSIQYFQMIEDYETCRDAALLKTYIKE